MQDTTKKMLEVCKTKQVEFSRAIQAIEAKIPNDVGASVMLHLRIALELLQEDEVRYEERIELERRAAYQEGYAAYQNGLAIDENPYIESEFSSNPKDASSDWSGGFEAARDTNPIDPENYSADL